jgi:hypothetical protein
VSVMCLMLMMLVVSARARQFLCLCVHPVYNYCDASRACLVALLPYQPPLKLLREVMIESFQKPHIEAKTTGMVTLHIASISAGFASYGVSL